jgi:hypothetical protein
VGQEVAVSGVDALFNGIIRVATVPTSKSFTYALVGTSVVESIVRPTGLVQRTSNLPVGQTYYYRIASIYTDSAQSCGSTCLSAYSSPITVDGRFGVTTSFPFTGSTATYTVPAGVEKIQVDVQGAQGGSSAAPVVGGKGGRVRATLPVTPGETLFLNVGGGGGTHFPFFFKDDVSAGFNGGGTGTGNGSGGGGASDIRRGVTVTNAVLNNNVVTLTTATAHGLVANNAILVAGISSVFDGTYTVVASPTSTTLTYAKTNANVASVSVNGALIQSSLVTSVARRVVVAGGGGGFGHAKNPGGAGGGLIGAEGTSNDGTNVSGLGGTQTSGSALGVGGNGSTNAGGGGGGYWGGYGSGQGGQPDGRSTSGYSGGGGGSSWTASDIVFYDHTQGHRSGNGLITITTAQESLIPSPSNLTATGWNRRVHLAWTASKNQEATGYRIKWGISAGALTNVINVSGGSTSEYVHSDLAMGTRFFYSIATRYTDVNQDCGTECLSDFSSEVSEITRFTATDTFEFTESIQS